MIRLSDEAVAQVLARHDPLSRLRRPLYQKRLLCDLAQVWGADHRRVLDVGGGTGLVGQALHALFGAELVVSADVHRRFRPGLEIRPVIFDGRRLPFSSAAFDCVVLSNVVHHVAVGDRPLLLAECRRAAGRGPIYIKDHLTRSALDTLRLAALDLAGNLPSGGMVWARYLSPDEWRDLAQGIGDQIEFQSAGPYRRGPLAAAFPNRLEILMRWSPEGSA